MNRWWWLAVYLSAVLIGGAGAYLTWVWSALRTGEETGRRGDWL
jgi:hypothetical protein